MHMSEMYKAMISTHAPRTGSDGGNTIPAVFHKKNNADILVTMRLSDWMNLYTEWEAGHDLKEKEQ